MEKSEWKKINFKIIWIKSFRSMRALALFGVMILYGGPFFLFLTSEVLNLDAFNALVICYL